MANILYIDQAARLDESYMYPYYGAIFRELVVLHNVYLEQSLTIPDINRVLNKHEVKFDCIIFELGIVTGKLNLMFI